MTENSLDIIIADIYQEFGDDKDNSNCKVMMREHFVDKLQVYEIPEALVSRLRELLQKEGYEEGSYLPQMHVTSILNDMMMRNIDTVTYSVSQTGSDLDNIENYSEICSQSYSAYGGDSPAKVLKESNSSNSLVSYAQKENERLKKQLKENEKEHEKTNEQCIKYESENEYLRREIESLKKQKKMLSHQNDNLKADQADFVDVRNELDEAKQTIKDMEFEVKKLVNEKDEAWSTVKCVRSEKDGIRMELDQERDNSAMKDEERNILDKEYNDKVRSYESQIAALNAKITMQNETISGIENERDNVRRERDELKDMSDDLQLRLNNLENGEVIQFSDIPAPESMHQELAQSEDYLQAKEDEIQKLRQDLDLKSTNIAELLEQKNNFEITIDHLKNEIDRLDAIVKIPSRTTRAAMPDLIIASTQTDMGKNTMETLHTPILASSGLTRVQKLLAVILVGISILIYLLIARKEPWISVNCPGTSFLTY